MGQIIAVVRNIGLDLPLTQSRHSAAPPAAIIVQIGLLDKFAVRRGPSRSVTLALGGCEAIVCANTPKETSHAF